MGKIPVLFVFFNRREETLKAIEAIKEYKPTKLYLASDGYRENKKGEEQTVIDLRNEIISLIDWDCEVKTLFRDKNLGCCKAVSSAIDWMFSQEEYGIIIEDDCIVQNSFWNYMEELLELYKDDQRIGAICGFNTLGAYKTEHSYVFSNFKSCWGWATWKRAWKNLDMDMQWLKSCQKEDVINNYGYNGKDKRENIFKIHKLKNHLVNSWAWRWYFSLAAHNQLCIFPSVNLVSNIGFGENSTHTKSKAPSNSVACEELAFPLKHPQYIVPCKGFDADFHKDLYSIKRRIRNILIPLWVYKLISKQK